MEKLEGDTFISDEFKTFVKSCESLQKLSLFSLNETDFLLDFLPETLQQLVVFDASSCRLTEEQVAHIIAHCVSLEVLRLANDAELLDEEVISLISKNGKTLKSLQITSDLIYLSSQTLQCIASHCVVLELLTLYFNDEPVDYTELINTLVAHKTNQLSRPHMTTADTTTDSTAATTEIMADSSNQYIPLKLKILHNTKKVLEIKHTYEEINIYLQPINNEPINTTQLNTLFVTVYPVHYVNFNSVDSINDETFEILARLNKETIYYIGFEKCPAVTTAHIETFLKACPLVNILVVSKGCPLVNIKAVAECIRVLRGRDVEFRHW